MIKVSFKTQNGHYLIANDASSLYRIAATPDGVGSWEVFTMIRADGANSDVIRSGDSIHLQTHHGRYVMAQAGGGGPVTGEATLPNIWETFTIEKLAGGDEIVHGDRVTLRANNGRNYLMARDGGGADVTAESSHRSVWETFSIEFWNPMLVRLRAHDSHYLAAENGGGREITATRDSANIWETFTLINRSRKSGLHDGDAVCLQVWDRRFVSAQGGGGSTFLANKNRAGRLEIFTVQKAGGGEISLSDSVSFRTQNGVNYVMALNGGGGAVKANSMQAREWETFQIEAAEVNPIPFSSAPSAPAATGHPLPSPCPRVTGSRKLICFLIGFQDSPVDDSIAAADLSSFFFDERNSVRAWVKRTSYNAFTLSAAGAFGPMTVPWDYVSIPDQDYFSGLLRLAEGSGLVFRNLDTDRNGIITGDELLFIVVDCTNAVGGGQTRPISFTHDGVRYDGTVFTVGIYTKGGPVQGRAQLERILGTITHELSHMLFNLPDRYYQPFPPRGDVVATGQNRGADEKFALVGTDGSIVRSGNRVRLQMQDDGSFLVFDGSDRKYLNREGTRVDPQGEFVIERNSGGGTISHGDQVHLKAVTTRKYLMANQGGGHIVQVIAGRPSTWETFIIESDAGSGVIHSNDVITLKTTTNNVYGASFYLKAEADGRRTDAETLARGWWSEWAKSPPGDGVGGDFDIMDNDKDRGIHAAYDRIKRGWIVPRVLTPDNKACYVLNPSIDTPEAFVLWDPIFPDEWYVIENRQRRELVDDTPSSGLIVSWVDEQASYWSRWRVGDGAGQYPAVISAAASSAPPNGLIQPVLLRSDFYKRRDPNTAFRSGTYVLPRGDGSRSRFRLSFTDLADERVAFCIL